MAPFAHDAISTVPADAAIAAVGGITSGNWNEDHVLTEGEIGGIVQRDGSARGWKVGPLDIGNPNSLIGAFLPVNGALPPGGTAGQILQKQSSVPYDALWVPAAAGWGGVADVLWTGPSPPADPAIELWADTDESAPGGPPGDPGVGVPPAGATGYILTKASPTDYDTVWSAPAGLLDDSVTNAKLRNSAGLSVIGRASDTTGDPADIVAGVDGQVLTRVGNTLVFAGLPATVVPDDSITNAKLRNSAPTSVIGRSSGTSGDPADIATTADEQVLRRSGGILSFGAIALGNAAAVSGVLPLANGGTGAGTAVGARANLGVPGIPVTVAQGGTGATDAAGARANLDVFSKGEIQGGVALSQLKLANGAALYGNNSAGTPLPLIYRPAGNRVIVGDAANGITLDGPDIRLNGVLYPIQGQWITWGSIQGIAVGGDNVVYLGGNAAQVQSQKTMGVVGDLHVTGTIYKTGVAAYNFPDYVFEHHYSGRIETFKDAPGAKGYGGLLRLAVVEQFTKDNWRLPYGSSHDLFRRADDLLAEIERLYLYLFDQERRLSALEKGFARPKGQD
jgi:hypothetical protein